MDESAPRPLTRAELLYLPQGVGGNPNSMTSRRLESREPELVPIWGSLTDFGARFFFLTDLVPGLPPTPAGNFPSESAALDWLVAAVNEHLPEVCRQIRKVQSDRLAIASERAKEIAAQAQRNSEMAEKRARDSEVTR